jgi:hypothetical protein
MFIMVTQRIRKHPPKRVLKRLTKRELYSQLSSGLAQVGIGIAGIVYLVQLAQFWSTH